MTSKVVLSKCRAEGLDIKNHMSTVSAGLDATIREWFSEPDESDGTAVETAAHVDLTKARAQARKSRRRKQAEAEAEEAQKAEEAAKEQAAAVAVAEAPAEAAPEAGAEAQAPFAIVEAEEAAEAPEAEPEAVEAPAKAVAEAAPPAEAAEAVEVAEAAPPAEAEAIPEEALPVEEAAEDEEKPKRRRKREPIQPAGPQLVPKPAKLQGPRIVRVEAPDFVDAPRRRRPPVPTQVGPTPILGRGGRRGAGAPPVVSETAEARKKGKRRSPRRRGGTTTTGRSADSGDRIKEWRERDLQEREARLAAAGGGGLRRHRASVGRKGGVGPMARDGKIEIDEPITVKSLSAATGLKSADILRKLMGMGTLATINQGLNVETAEAVVAEFGIELEVRRAKTAEEELFERLDARPSDERKPRAPVVTFLGHVDHGKTSLLDRIRHTQVAGGEAGGITQHMGAYRYDVGDRHVVFLDTPGHEAFTAMRARGANMTDVVVLVVAADDGVMPQTVEAISHARAAGVPIVVALNKIDVPNANVQRALGQLSENHLQPREWGGDVEVIHTSATTGEGIDNLVEVLSLEAELLELTTEIDAPASGYVIEAEMDPGRGALARLLVLNGTLKVGDVVLGGRGYGRVRQLVDDKGNDLQQAGPSTPVEVAGLDEAPEAGDRFHVLTDIDEARNVAEDRRQRARAQHLATGTKATLESLLSQIESGEASEVPIIMKADVRGSVEALTGSLEKLSTDEVRVNILHSAVGGISTGDVTLAEASGAIIIGFNAVPDAAARQLAERGGVEIRLYRVIYDVVDDVRKIMEEGLTPEIREETLGRAEVRQTFKVSRMGTIAGCYVTDGSVNRNAMVRITRNNIVVGDERKLDSLKRFKDDAREVRQGLECGLKIAGYDDIKEGDILEFYQKVEVARTL